MEQSIKLLLTPKQIEYMAMKRYQALKEIIKPLKEVMPTCLISIIIKLCSVINIFITQYSVSSLN